MSDGDGVLPAHIEDTVKSIGKLHADHYNQSSPLQRLVDRVIAFIGRPRFVGILTVFVFGWIAVNLLGARIGVEPFDPPPFAWLEGIVSLTALYVTVMILATQRREDELSQHREQLTLELAVLSEQKSAKIISLIEEMRRDDPHLRNRIDQEATDMSEASDPHSVLQAIKKDQLG